MGLWLVPESSIGAGSSGGEHSKDKIGGSAEEAVMHDAGEARKWAV
jgi:hypothetical protein